MQLVHPPELTALCPPKVFPLLGSLPWIMVAMVTFGLGVGTTMALYNLIMVRFMGLENLAPVFGASSIALAVGFITVGPLIGECHSRSLLNFRLSVTDACVFLEFPFVFFLHHHNLRSFYISFCHFLWIFSVFMEHRFVFFLMHHNLSTFLAIFLNISAPK